MNPRNLRLALAGAALVAGTSSFEGLSRIDYADNLPAKPVPTACYGHTGPDVKIGTVRTKAQCDELLQWDLTYVYGPAVLQMVDVPITQGQYNALTDFAYNLGTGNLRKSTLLRKVNANDPTAVNEFGKWVYVGGKDCRLKINKCSGIVERRKWEAAQYASSAAETK